MISRWRQLIIRSELQQPMRKTISYKMNLAWQADDKLFMFPHEERRLASTVVCGGCRGGPDRSSREKRNVGSRRRGNAAVLLAGHAGETKSPCRFDPLRLLGPRSVGYLRCCAALRDMNHADLLGQIKSPTLVISGERDVATPWTGHGEILAREIPGAKALHLAAAHLSNLERPHSFTTALLAFLLPQPNTNADSLRAGF